MGVYGSSDLSRDPNPTDTAVRFKFFFKRKKGTNIERTMIESSAAPVTDKVAENVESEANIVVNILEDAIQTANEDFPVPEVTPEEIAPPVRCCDVVSEFKWPVTALCVVGASAFGVIYTAIPTYYQFFPFYACLINFLGGVPSTKGSLDSMAGAIIPRLEVLERRIQETAQNTTVKASNGYTSYTNFILQKGEYVVNTVKEKIGTNASDLAITGNILQSYSIPDSTIKKELSSEKFIGNEADVSNNILRGSKYVCLPFQSKELFTFFITIPILLTLLVMQMLAVWYFREVFNGNPIHKTEQGDLEILADKKWTPLTISLSTFAVVVVQILVALLLSNATRVAKIVNARLQERSKDIIAFKAHLASCMIFLKKKLVQFLEFVAATLKIKEIGQRVTGMINGSLAKAIEWSRMNKSNNVP